MGVKKALNKKQLRNQTKLLLTAGWKLTRNETQLQATFAQPDYISGLVFIARIAVHAEIAQHHPDISYTYHAVKVSLTTHDVKGLTAKDIALADTITKLSTKSS